MKILIVSSAPTAHCGIARYAVQQATVMRQEGHTVDWASCDGGTEGVKHPLKLHDWTDFAKLPVIARGYDRVIMHYQHDLYFRGLDPADISYKNLILAGLFSLHPNVEVVAHELLYKLLSPKEMPRRIWSTERLKWSMAKKLVLHTDRERVRLLEQMPTLAPRIELKEHHSEMVKFRDISQEIAREELGVPARGKVFLCIGFIQESKGFDRAIRAFSRIAAPDARLYVVGSIRVEEPQHRRHLEMMKQLASLDPRIKVIERFVDDALFDTWISASDVVVLPYRHIWSSSVAARARLFEKRLLVSNVGGLKEQLAPGDFAFETEIELTQALSALSGGPKASLVRKHRSGEGLRLAFVLPWYGSDIPGGAESQARRTAIKLASTGAKVEVLTSTVQDYFHDWSVNARKAGVELVDGLPVRRFPVAQRNAAAFAAVNAKVTAKQPIDANELRIFQDEMIKCPQLIEYISTHRKDYDFFIFTPYMFATSAKGAAACPGQAIHIPCIHDEGYLELDWYKETMRSAAGIFFNAPPERDLAVSHFGLRADRYILAGMGLETDWFGDGESFKFDQGLGDYLTFVGRKEDTKNFPMLLQYFRRYRDERAPDLSLLIFGPGSLQADPADGRSVIDFGFAPEGLKRDALAGALALCQPSVLESFSLTVMESWLAERPVLVHTDGAVTRNHCERSGGGLWFKTYFEFAACVDRLRADKVLAAKMGRAGRDFVNENYSWPVVLDKYLEGFERWKAPAVVRAAS